PAFNWVGQMKNFTWQMAHYHHTKHDVAEKMRPDSFEDYGTAAERLVRSIDQLHEVPENFRDSSYFKLTSSYYIDGWVMTLLRFLAFVPFFLFSINRFGNIRSQLSYSAIRRILKNEMKNVVAIFGAFLVGYTVVRLMPALKLIQQYETFPATQKSLI